MITRFLGVYSLILTVILAGLVVRDGLDKTALTSLLLLGSVTLYIMISLMW